MEKLPKGFEREVAYLASPVPEGTLTEEESDAIIEKGYAVEFFGFHSIELTDEIWDAIVSDYKMMAAFLHDYGDINDGKPTPKEEYQKHFQNSVHKIYDRLMTQGNVEDPIMRALGSFLDNVPIEDALPSSWKEELNQENKQMSEQIVEKYKPLDVSESFIKIGEIHECILFGMDEKNPLNWRAIVVESVEVVGGQVFLGYRDVPNWLDSKDYVVMNTVHYRNLLAFSIIQRVGTLQRMNQEYKEYNKMMVREEQELARKKAEEATNAEAVADTDQQTNTQ